MNFQLHYLINSVLCWSIVLMAILGYFLTLKRTGQKWVFWVVLAAGWALLAISNSLVLLATRREVLTFWACGYHPMC